MVVYVQKIAIALRALAAASLVAAITHYVGAALGVTVNLIVEAFVFGTTALIAALYVTIGANTIDSLRYSRGVDVTSVRELVFFAISLSALFYVLHNAWTLIGEVSLTSLDVAVLFLISGFGVMFGRDLPEILMSSDEFQSFNRLESEIVTYCVWGVVMLIIDAHFSPVTIVGALAAYVLTRVGLTGMFGLTDDITRSYGKSQNSLRFPNVLQIVAIGIGAAGIIVSAIIAAATFHFPDASISNATTFALLGAALVGLSIASGQQTLRAEQRGRIEEAARAAREKEQPLSRGGISRSIADFESVL